MIIIFILFELVIALNCNQFKRTRNVRLSQGTKIKQVRTVGYRKEHCSLFSMYDKSHALLLGKPRRDESEKSRESFRNFNAG